MMGQTADISHLCEYQWFDWVMYYEPINGYPTDKATIEPLRRHRGRRLQAPHKTSFQSHNYEPNESEVWCIYVAQQHFSNRGEW